MSLLLSLLSSALAAPGALGIELSDSSRPSVQTVQADSAAAAMGLQDGDVIVGVNGRPVRTRSDLRAHLGNAGADVVVSVKRGERTMSLAGNLGAAVSAQVAPPIEVDRWGRTDAAPSYEGKATVILVFQHACHACHEHGFPFHKELETALKDRDDVQFVYLQAAVHAPRTNSYANGLKDVEAFGLSGLYAYDGVDAKTGELPWPITALGTYGTPWTVLVDAGGNVVFNGFTPDDLGSFQTLIDLSFTDAAARARRI